MFTLPKTLTVIPARTQQPGTIFTRKLTLHTSRGPAPSEPGTTERVYRQELEKLRLEYNKHEAI